MGEPGSGTGKLEMERQGRQVRIIVQCETEYDAMMLYDRGCKEIADGYVRFTFETKK